MQCGEQLIPEIYAQGRLQPLGLPRRSERDKDDGNNNVVNAMLIQIALALIVPMVSLVCQFEQRVRTETVTESNFQRLELKGLLVPVNLCRVVNVAAGGHVVINLIVEIGALCPGGGI